MYYGARYYDATLGRFVSADTVVPNAGNPQSLNRYAYTLNNPVRYTDPTGHFTDEEIQKSLKDEYGENWERVWKAWQEDEYWMWILHTARGGWEIWMANTGFSDGGKFTVNSKGRIQVRLRNDAAVQLWNVQQVGAYQIRGDGQRPEYKNLTYGTIRPVFAYDSKGVPGGVRGYQQVARLRLEFDGKLALLYQLDTIFNDKGIERSLLGWKFEPPDWGVSDDERVNPFPEVLSFMELAVDIHPIVDVAFDVRDSTLFYPIRYFIKECGSDPTCTGRASGFR